MRRLIFDADESRASLGAMVGARNIKSEPRCGESWNLAYVSAFETRGYARWRDGHLLAVIIQKHHPTVEPSKIDSADVVRQVCDNCR